MAEEEIPRLGTPAMEGWFTFWNLAGDRIDLYEWTLQLVSEEQIVAQEDVPGTDWQVSTVFIGCGYTMYETLVFGGSLDGQGYRWATEEEARVGHALVMTLARAEAEMDSKPDVE